MRNFLKARLNSSTVVCFLAIALLVTPLKILSLLMLLVVLAQYLPFPSKHSSLTLRSIFTFLLFTVVLQAAGLIAWKLSLPLLWSWTVLIIGLITLALTQSRTHLASQIVSKNDVVAGIVSFVSVLTIASTTLTGGTVTQQLLRYFVAGFDNTAHISLTVSLYDRQGYIYGPAEKTANEIVYPSLSSYPQGWHLTNAFLWHGLGNDLSFKQSPQKILAIFFATTMLWYGMAIFLFTSLLLQLATKLRKKRASTTMSVIGSITIITLMQVTILFSILRFGFGNFIALLTYFAALLILGLYSAEERSQRKAKFLVIGLLFCVGISYTWLLAAPIGFLFVLFVFLQEFKKPLPDLLIWFKKNILLSIASMALVGISAIQGVIQIKYTIIPGSINAEGGIWQINYLLLSALASITIAWIMVSKDIIVRQLLAFVIAAGSMTGFIYFYQYYTAGKTNYYSYKIEAILLVFLLIIVGALFIVALEKLASIHGKLLASGLAICLLFMVPMVSGLDMKDLRFANGSGRELSAYTASQLTGLIAEKKAYDSNVFVFKNLDYEEDIIGTHFVNMFSRKEPTCMQNFIWHKLSGQRDTAEADIHDCANTNPHIQYYVLVSKDYLQSLRHQFADTTNVNIILTN